MMTMRRRPGGTEQSTDTGAGSLAGLARHRDGTGHGAVCPQLGRRGLRPTAEQRDDYADVAEMFRALSRFPMWSAEFHKQRLHIIERCLPLAENISRRYRGRGVSADDLLQVARLGLLGAVDRFDVGRGTDFVVFAVPTITGEVKRYFRDYSWPVSVPRRLKDLQSLLTLATHELSQRWGRPPTASELALHLGLDRQDVIEGILAGLCYRSVSVDASACGDDTAPARADRLGRIDGGIDHVECQQALRPLLDQLPARQRAILVMWFFESLTQTEIACRIGISQMHVSRLLRQSLNHLRAELTG